MQQEVTPLSKATAAIGQEVIVLTKEGRVRLISPRTRAWLAEYFVGESLSASESPA
jgi:hypothetical protein